MSRQIAVIDDMLGDLVGPGPREMMDGAFDAASRYDRTMATWHPPIQSADADILPDKPLMDARTRDVLRNDGYVAAGSSIRKDRIVGAAYLLNSKPEWKLLGLDDTWAKEFQEEVETKFTLYAESPECWIHAGRAMTFTDIIRLAVGLDVACGEFLASAEWLRDSGRPYNTALQVIDVDRLSTPWGEVEGPTLRGGIRKNRMGAPLGYYIRNSHPGENMWGFNNPADQFTWKYVKARKPWGRVQMIHNFEQLRPDQTRGLSELVSALKEIRITRRHRDVTLQNAVLNATYAASIESDMPPEAVWQALGAEGGGNGAAGAVDYAKQYLNAISAYAGSARNLQLDGVKIPHLFPGTKLNLQPVKDNTVGSDFEKSLLRYLSSTLNVDYHEFTHDFSDANYSNIKASLASTGRAMQAKKRRSADRIANMVLRLWMEEAINKGEITSMPRNAPNFYEGMNAEAYCAAQWIGATHGQVDELKETQAAVLRLKYNLSTHEDEAARLGKDWRKLFMQKEREKQDMEDRGLTVDESNAINAASGDVRESKTDGDDETNKDDTKDE